MNRCCAVLPILFLALGLSAQPDRHQKFAAAGYLGFNFSQIHGDSYFGYNNAGVRFGLETQYLLRPEYFISLGIGYSSEGARPSRKEVDAKGGNATTLKLNMVEIPLLFNYRLGDKKHTGKKNDYGLFRSTTLQAGVKLTRLFGFRTVNRGYLDQILVNPAFTRAEIEFQDFDLAVVGGVTFRLGLRGAVFVQHSLSVRGLYGKKDLETAQEGTFDVFQLRPYSLSVGGKLVFY